MWGIKLLGISPHVRKDVRIDVGLWVCPVDGHVLVPELDRPRRHLPLGHGGGSVGAELDKHEAAVQGPVRAVRVHDDRRDPLEVLVQLVPGLFARLLRRDSPDVEPAVVDGLADTDVAVGADFEVVELLHGPPGVRRVEVRYEGEAAVVPGEVDHKAYLKGVKMYFFGGEEGVSGG